MRVSAYLRVTTDQQSHESQRAELEDYCKRRSWESVRWFTDTASGAKQGRDGRNALIEQVRRGKIDVVTFKRDRPALRASENSDPDNYMKWYKTSVRRSRRSRQRIEDRIYTAD